MESSPALTQINLIVTDMDRTVTFYRMLGLPIDALEGEQHVEVSFSSGMTIEFDARASVENWDSGWSGAAGGSSVLGFQLHTAELVDEVFTKLVAAGYRAHQRPYDAFWGARYAIVDDPDGHPVGLMGPVDETQRTWPPAPPPE